MHGRASAAGHVGPSLEMAMPCPGARRGRQTWLTRRLASAEGLCGIVSPW